MGHCQALPAKYAKIKTALIGAVVIENDIESMAEHYANKTIVNSNGTLSVALVAPSSVMDYISFVLTAEKQA
jgi:hypothetical protein